MLWHHVLMLTDLYNMLNLNILQLCFIDGIIIYSHEYTQTDALGTPFSVGR